MRAPAAATAWYLWRQHRWQAMVVVVYFIAVAVVAHVLPDDLYYHVLTLAIALPLSSVPVYWVAVFTYGWDADLSTRESIYPSWMLTLPVRSRALAGWPMFYGTATMAATWLLAAEFLLRPRGIVAPLCRPALALSAGLAWFQALFWLPMGLPWIRPLVAVVLTSVLVILPGTYASGNVSEPLILAWLAVQLPVAYCVAVVGVSRSRRGDTPDWRWRAGRMRGLSGRSPRRRKPFASPAKAQCWLEWRRYGQGMPVAVAVIAPFFAALIVVTRLVPDLATNSPFRSPMILLLLPPWLAAAFSIGFGELTEKRKDRGLSSFLATRPITSAGFFTAKVDMAARAVLAAYAVMLPIALATAFFTGALGEIDAWWRLLLARFSPWEAAVIVLLGAVGLVVGAWLILIENMLFGLTGRRWAMGAVAGISFPLIATAIFLGLWIYRHPQLHDALLAAVPWLVAMLAGVKCLCAGWTLHAVRRRKLLAPKAVRRLAGVWLAGVVALFAVLCWVVPSEVAPRYLLASCAVLALPLARIGLAPMAVAWNRHR